MSQADWTLSSYQIFIDLSTFEQHYARLKVTHIQVQFLHGCYFFFTFKYLPEFLEPRAGITAAA